MLNMQEFKTIITNIKALIMAKQANAKQKKFMSDIAEWAYDDGMLILYGNEWCKDFHLHHVLGRTAKHNKISIGHEFILPVPIELHDPNLNHKYHVSKCKHAFTNKFGKQSFLFSEMYRDMKSQGYDVPSELILNTILDTKA